VLNLFIKMSSSNLKDFIECIDSGKVPRVTGVDGLNVVKVIETALESAPTGKQINVK
jgi:predicted dehydrogenase